VPDNRRVAAINTAPVSSAALFLPARDAALFGAGAILVLIGFVAGLFIAARLPADLAAYAPWIPYAGAVGGIGLLVAALRPEWVFYAFVFFCILSYETLETISVPLGFMKLYIPDVVLAFSCSYVLLRVVRGKVVPRRLVFSRLLLLYFALGCFSAYNGLVLNKNPYDKVFGDFRRTFVYFLNYFVVLYLIDDLAEAFRFRTLLVTACGLLIAKGYFQVLTGQFYYRRMGDAAHILSHIELTFLSFGVFYALSRLLYGKRIGRTYWAVYSLLGVIITVIGNYRASWLGLAGGLLFLFLFQPMRRRIQILGLIVGLAVLSGLAMYALWDVEIIEHSTLGTEIAAKADVKEAPVDINVVWRLDSYRATLEYWRQRPWLGCGLGTSVDFSTITSTGVPMLALDHRVHNSFIWLWMTQGVLGFPFAMLPHVGFLFIVIRYLRRTQWAEGKITVMACAGYAVSMLISTAFELFLEGGTTITVYSAILGLAMLTIYYTPQEEQRLAAQTQAASG